MTSPITSNPPGVAEAAGEPVEHLVQVYLEREGSHSWKRAVVGAVIGAGGGPLYRFVAVSPGGRHDANEYAAAGQPFPLEPLQDLDSQSDNEWADLARQRLDELDAELRRTGWCPLGDQGTHWWSRRYQR